jgi:hypothetical protein
MFAGFTSRWISVELLRGAQPFGHLTANAQGLRLLEMPLTPDALLQAAAADEFHGNVKIALVVAHGVELDDVRVRHVRGDVRLLAKLLQADGIPRVLAIEDLQCHAPAQCLVLRLEHPAHAPLADLAHDHEMVEPPPHPHHLPAKRAFQLRERLQRRDIDLLLADRAGAEKGLFWRTEDQRGLELGGVPRDAWHMPEITDCLINSNH